ncbi:sulfatase [Polaribacter sp. Q13]|uniref:sulfatase family protein n=1 Tax=Polaribacter sp. Q13 TaxID=2806551 RepID=UPI00193B354A|nr:sulfatase-like hydrolase/transferase [Polaribacter sp. Q13]QVY66085.1 sulfatase-like hydrolase/transferase [Polaribacter sp. Q13]
MKKSKIIFNLIAGCLILIGHSALAQNKKPNIIVIVADDLGYATTGTYGQDPDRIKTPNIDRIAKEGAQFTNAYVTASVCGPSRSGLLTGRYQQRFGSYANFDSQRGPGVPASEKVMGTYFKKAGYTTAAIGKWHIGVKLPGQHPIDRGFDKYYGFNSAQTDYFNSPILFDGKKKVKKHDYLTFQFTNEAINFIEDTKDKPFFMYLAYNAVHGPNQVPKEYSDKFDTGKKGDNNMLGMLAALDDSIGKLLDYLKEKNLEENTLVYFLSDNGGLSYWYKGNNAPWNGFKREQWEGGYHVQYLMRWPKMIKAGQVRNEMISSLDILPTSLAAAGIKASKKDELDGVNLLPIFNQKETKVVHPYLFWAGSHVPGGDARPKSDFPYKKDNAPPSWAVRSGKWKLVQMMGLGAPMLYDLDADPTESKDLIANHPKIVSTFKAEFHKWFKDMKTPIAWDKKHYEMLKTIK